MKNTPHTYNMNENEKIVRLTENWWHSNSEWGGGGGGGTLTSTFKIAWIFNVSFCISNMKLDTTQLQLIYLIFLSWLYNDFHLGNVFIFHVGMLIASIFVSFFSPSKYDSRLQIHVPYLDSFCENSKYCLFGYRQASFVTPNMTNINNEVWMSISQRVAKNFFLDLAHRTTNSGSCIGARFLSLGSRNAAFLSPSHGQFQTPTWLSSFQLEWNLMLKFPITLLDWCLLTLSLWMPKHTNVAMNLVSHVQVSINFCSKL